MFEFVKLIRHIPKPKFPIQTKLVSLSGPIPKVRRSYEFPPLQRRRSFPFPLKQLLSLSMVLMVTPFPSRFRPPPDPPPPDLPPWSLCKSRPFKARFLIVPPEPPEPPDVPLLLAPLLQTLESSINPVVFLPRCSSLVPVAVASPLRFFASTIGLTGTVFGFQHSSSFQLEPQFIFAETSSLLVKLSKGFVSVSLWNKSYLYEPCLVLGVSCLKMSPLPLNEDIVLPLNLILPQFEDVASDRSLPLYEDGASDLLSLPLYEDVALPSASSAGFSKLQEIWDSIVLFSTLHSGMDLNEIAGCLLTNLATLFSPLSFNFYQCTALCLAVAIAMCVFFRLCSSITLF
ncbi:hypothetical protein HID58_026955 [Brassica napus]|uniref:Uncharacterized protein n=1 Tax=Brassica napus TaxID=3708 RepID=A0ABQ8CQD2_BRANA|nr:hypothetical protein HID58_026955 [Brassica napus]